MEIKLIRTESLHLYDGNPRKGLSVEGLAALAHSIDEDGILVPLMVVEDGDGFAVVDGGRRLRAAQALGATELPCVVMPSDDRAARIAAWVANYEREEVSWVDEAVWMSRMLALLECQPSDLAADIGRSEAYVRSRLALFEWPEALREYAERVRGRFSVLRTYAQLGEGEDVSNAIAWDEINEPSSRQAIGYVDAIMARRGAVPGAERHEAAGEDGRFRGCGVCGNDVDWTTARVIPVCGECLETAREAFAEPEGGA